MDEYELDDLADAASRSARLLEEALQWLRACLNIVDGDGSPPNWDEIRTFIKLAE
jgi:hypothetical protein